MAEKGFAAETGRAAENVLMAEKGLAAEKESVEESLRWDRRGRHGRMAIVIVLLIATLFPVYFLLISSLKSSGEYTTNLFLPPLRGWDFANWATTIPRLVGPAMNSTVISIGTALIILVILVPCAYVFVWHRFPGKEKLFTFAIATMLMPSILTFVPLYIQIRDMGLMNTKWAVILPAVTGGIGVSLFLMRAFFSALPADLVEAARVDGASERQIILRIVLPLSLPGLITIAVLMISAAWNQYLWPLVTLTSESERVSTVAAAFFVADPYAIGDTPVLMAAYIVSSLPLIVIMATLLRYFMSGATAGAIKG